MQTNKAHFTDKDFRYSLTRKSIRNYLFRTSGISFLFTIFIITFLVVRPHNLIPALPLFLPMIFLIGGGLNLILFANYYRYANGKVLIMSKGNDQFWFGPSDNPEQFNKKEIMLVKRYCGRGYRNPVGSFAWVEIELTNARYLIIPNLLIDDQELADKLFEYSPETVNRGFPSIPSSASTPS
jgi:hypothetical protein